MAGILTHSYNGLFLWHAQNCSRVSALLLMHNMYMADYLFNQMKEMTETQSYESIRVNLSSCFYLLNCTGGQRIGFFFCRCLLIFLSLTSSAML